MKLTRIKRYKKTLKMTSGLFLNNAVLGMGQALPFVIVPTITLKNGVAMSVLLFVATVPTAIFSAVLKDKISLFLKVPLLMLTSMACAILANIAMPALVMEELGIYATLVATNSILFEFVSYKKQQTLGKTAIEAVKMCLGFAVVACAISAFREILTYQTIWNHGFGLYPIKMDGVNLPFFGFIILGFWAALFRSINRWVSRSILSKDIAGNQGNDADMEECK